MRIVPGLGFYRRPSFRAQIGIDTRRGVSLCGLSQREVRLVSALTAEHTKTEFLQLARALHINAARAGEILALLEDARVLTDCGASCAEESAWLRIRGELPAHRARCAVHLAQLDPLSVHIAEILMRAGITRFSLPAHADSLLYTAPSEKEKEKRRRYFLNRFRQINAKIRVCETEDAHIAVLSGVQIPNPIVAAELMSLDIPVLLCWSEEIDVYVGPLSRAHETACAQCLFLYRRDECPQWDEIYPQTLLRPPYPQEYATLTLAAALGARAVLDFLDRGENTLTGSRKISPDGDFPQYCTIAPHPECGCRDPNLQSAADRFRNAQSSSSRHL